MNLNFLPVTAKNLESYLTVGTRSYKEHYLHLWENNDPSPFINVFLTKNAVIKSLKDPLQLFYLISTGDDIAGILNITLNAKKGSFLSEENLLLNKIYLLKQYTAMGIGTATLQFVEELAKKNKKDVVWLYAMKKGKPLEFYKKYDYKTIKDACIDLPNVLNKEKEMWLMAKKI